MDNKPADNGPAPRSRFEAEERAAAERHRETIKTQLEQETKAILTTANSIDAALARVMQLAQDGKISDHGATTLADARDAGEVDAKVVEMEQSLRDAGLLTGPPASGHYRQWLENAVLRGVSIETIKKLAADHHITPEDFEVLDGMEEIREDEDGNGISKSYFLMPTDISGDDAAKAVRMTYILNAGTDYGTEGEATDFNPTPYGSEELQRITDRQREERLELRRRCGVCARQRWTAGDHPERHDDGLGWEPHPRSVQPEGRNDLGRHVHAEHRRPGRSRAAASRGGRLGPRLVRRRWRPATGRSRHGPAAPPRGAPLPTMGERGLHGASSPPTRGSRSPAATRPRKTRDFPMADIARWPRVACAALLVASATAACDTKAQFAPSLPPAAGFRVDDGVLKLWTGTPCRGVTGLRLIFDSGTEKSTEQVWSAPQPGVLVERMDLLSTAGGSSPDTAGPLQVQKPLPADYDWTKADSINFSVDGPKAFGARVDVDQVLTRVGPASVRKLPVRPARLDGRVGRSTREPEVVPDRLHSRPGVMRVGSHTSTPNLRSRTWTRRVVPPAQAPYGQRCGASCSARLPAPPC